MPQKCPAPRSQPHSGHSPSRCGTPLVLDRRPCPQAPPGTIPAPCHALRQAVALLSRPPPSRAAMGHGQPRPLEATPVKFGRHRHVHPRVAIPVDYGLHRVSWSRRRICWHGHHPRWQRLRRGFPAVAPWCKCWQSQPLMSRIFFPAQSSRGWAELLRPPSPGRFLFLAPRAENGHPLLEYRRQSVTWEHLMCGPLPFGMSGTVALHRNGGYAILRWMARYWKGPYSDKMPGASSRTPAVLLPLKALKDVCGGPSPENVMNPQRRRSMMDQGFVYYIKCDRRKRFGPVNWGTPISVEVIKSAPPGFGHSSLLSSLRSPG